MWSVAGTVLSAAVGILAIESCVLCILLIIYSGYVYTSPLCYACMKHKYSLVYSYKTI